MGSFAHHNRNRGPNRLAVLALLLVAGWVGTAGCADNSPIDARVELDPQLSAGGRTPPNVEVHVFGVNQKDYQRFANLSMSNWWDPSGTHPERDEAMRQRNLVYVIRLGKGSTSRLISEDDPNQKPYFENWRRIGATHLFVLSNVPQGAEDKPGEADPRRAILEIQRRQWATEGAPVAVSVDRSGVHVKSGLKSN